MRILKSVITVVVVITLPIWALPFLTVCIFLDAYDSAREILWR